MARKRKGPNIGVTLTQDFLEFTEFNPKSFALENTLRVPMPEGVMADGGDRVADLEGLAAIIKDAADELDTKIKAVNVSVPGTLLRLIEMPKMGDQELYLSLSSEAERYKAFDDTEAVVEFEILPPMEATPSNMQRVAFGAIRLDTYQAIKKAFQMAKIKVANIDIEPMNVVRTMAGTGVLDSLVQQIGTESPWGTVFVSPGRVHFALWQGNSTLELREVSMHTDVFDTEPPDSPLVFDLVEEIRRTSSNLYPEIWLTHKLPENMAQGLSQQLGIPLRSCLMGPSLNLDDPGVDMATVGAAMHTQVDFPFDFDFQRGAAHLEGVATGGKEVAEDMGEEGPLPNILIASGALVVLLAAFIWGALSAFDNLYLGGQKSALQAQVQEKTNRQARLMAEVNQYEEIYRQEERLFNIIEKAQLRNTVYLELTQDLKNITPDALWVFTVEAGDQLILKGKAMTHQSVLAFAKAFDDFKYAQGVLIQSIKEEYIDSQGLFTFEISGQTSFPRALLSNGETAPQAADSNPPEEPATEGDIPADEDTQLEELEEI